MSGPGYARTCFMEPAAQVTVLVDPALATEQFETWPHLHTKSWAPAAQDKAYCQKESSFMAWCWYAIAPSLCTVRLQLYEVMRGK